jgi:hypothetical protein
LDEQKAVQEKRRVGSKAGGQKDEVRLRQM